MVIVIMIIFGLAYCYLISKITNASEKRSQVFYAIDCYVTEHDDPLKGIFIIANLESFWCTLFRLWDWGYENILPKPDYELIKPYLQGGKQK